VSEVSFAYQDFDGGLTCSIWNYSIYLPASFAETNSDIITPCGPFCGKIPQYGPVGGVLRKTSSAFRASHQGEIAEPGTPCFPFSIGYFIPKSTAWQEKRPPDLSQVAFRFWPNPQKSETSTA